MNRLSTLSLTLVFVVFGAFHTLAQIPRFEQLKVQKSQKEVEITSFVQDQDGFMWIGSNLGVAKFDGIDYQWFTHDNGLNPGPVLSLAVDATGQIWAGHKSGKISVIVNDKGQSFDPEEGVGTKPVSVIYTDSLNQPWFGTFGEGVYYYGGQNRKRLYNLNADDGLLDNYVYSITRDSAGRFYFATDKGISVYDSYRQQFTDHITMTDGLPDNIVTHLCWYNSELWIGMEDGGICRYNLKTRIFTTLTGWQFGAVSSFAFKSDHELWVNTKRKGLVKCTFDAQGGIWYKQFEAQNGLWDNRGTSLFCDYEQNLWIGSRKGLSLLRNIGIEFLDASDGLSLHNVYSMARDLNGTYWLATQDGLMLLQTDKMGKLSLKPCSGLNRFDGVSFISVHADKQGRIWAGTYGHGAFVINPHTLTYTQFNDRNGLPNLNVIHITSTDSVIWLSTLGGGVSLVDAHTLKITQTYSDAQGLSSNYIYSVFPVSNHEFWLATDGGGALKVVNNKIESLKLPLLDSLGKVVYTVLSDSLGAVWLNLADNGLVYLNDTVLKHFTVNNGLLTNAIQGIVLGPNGNLIAVSNQGVSVINAQSGNVVNYSDEYGLDYKEPNLNAMLWNSNGNILVGLANGMVTLNALSLACAARPTLLITRKSIYFNKIDSSQTTFKHNQNHVSFNYTANWFSMPGSLSYRYKLEGYDLDWSAETNARTITFSNLPSGKFVFRVQVKLPDGSWLGANKATFAFKIKPPFYKTIWFMALAVVVGVLSIIGFIRYRTAKLIHDKELLELEVKKRTAEISKQKEEIEAQRDEIEAQRNYVMEQRDHIEQQNKDITASIHYASRIQNAMLPPADSLNQWLGEHFIFFRPRDIVSGDFYYANVVHQKLVIAAADCTGHGVPGALMSMLGISLLNQILTTLPAGYNAADILNRLRDGLKTSLRQTGKKDEAKDGMDISLCVIDKAAMKLDYAGAYNPLLLVRANEAIVVKADKMPIGVFIGEEMFFANNALDLLPGDMLYLYSDGFQDQFGGPNKRKFMPKPFRQLLINNANLSLNEQRNLLEATFLNWIDYTHQIDDVLVLGIRV